MAIWAALGQTVWLLRVVSIVPSLRLQSVRQIRCSGVKEKKQLSLAHSHMTVTSEDLSLCHVYPLLYDVMDRNPFIEVQSVLGLFYLFYL